MSKFVKAIRNQHARSDYETQAGLSTELEMTPAEVKRIDGMLRYERELWAQGARLVAGVDEAGRGPLAGPVVAAAVILHENPNIPMVDDSKKVPATLREYLFDMIKNEALDFGIGVADVEEIDSLNILQASFLAMRRALKELSVVPDHSLVDGCHYHNDEIPYTNIVKGDSASYSIAAASILAKVTRDRLMVDYDTNFPAYGFSRHKGYATQAHLDAIEKFGFCSIHRKSFHPKRFLNEQLTLLDET